MKQLFTCLVLLFFITKIYAQVIPPDRRTNWSLAGLQDTAPVYTNTVDITDFGAVGDGVAVNDSCIMQAITYLNGNSGTIFIPPGSYLFHSPIVLPGRVVLKGAGADSSTLLFDLGGNGDLIRIAGTLQPSIEYLTSNAEKDSAFIVLSDSTQISVGDYLKLYQNDSSLVFSTWAYRTVGQIVRVKNVTGSRVELYSPLRKSFSVADNSRIQKILPRTHTGIECLKIKRLDASTGQTNNIDFNYAAFCWVKGVESDSTNFAHIAISNSTNIEISGCYLHNAYEYGGGGQGYGALVQYTSGECLVENNCFDRLRHSMILQAGANGNVFGYNSSTNPFWVSGLLPATSAGDMVLHGNYVFMNLFEGNAGQNIVIDDSHGSNGPYNTYFRNRADLYGIFMNTNPASNNQNIVGNEVTNSGFLMGLYQLNGTGHFEYGNNIKGTATPSGTSSLRDTSYYRKSNPGFWNNALYPAIGYPTTISSQTITARERFTNNDFTDCSLSYPEIVNSLTEEKSISRFSVFPNPTTGVLTIVSSSAEKKEVFVSDISGKTILMFEMFDLYVIHVNSFSSGIYFLKSSTGEQSRFVISE